MTIRTYEASVAEVVSHIESDRETVHALACIYDSCEMWENPDDRNYQAPLGQGIQPYFVGSEVMMNKIQHDTFVPNFATQIFSGEIRSKQTLPELAKMYKRLKESPAPIPSSVLGNIILKMLWVASGRANLVAQSD